jgi:Glycosyltransferase family 92
MQAGRDYLDVHYNLLTAPDHPGRAQRLRQGEAMKMCFEAYHDQSDWMIVLDIDEFLYPAAHGSLSAFFEAEVDDASSFVMARAEPCLHAALLPPFIVFCSSGRMIHHLSCRPFVGVPLYL